MNNLTRIVLAMAAGATLMYYLDPRSGQTRRALVRDRGSEAGRDAGRLVRAGAYDAADRARGFVDRLRQSLLSGPVDDVRLADRLRSWLDRLLLDPELVSLEVDHGHVILRGRASADEIDAIEETLIRLRGVVSYDNRLLPATEWTHA